MAGMDAVSVIKQGLDKSCKVLHSSSIWLATLFQRASKSTRLCTVFAHVDGEGKCKIDLDAQTKQTDLPEDQRLPRAD